MRKEMKKRSSKNLKNVFNKGGLTRLGPVTAKNKSKRKSRKWLIHPDSSSKMVWDLVIIVLSIYNAILIPYEFAYSLNKIVLMDVIDRIIDTAFIIDIIISFRTMYRDSKTDELVANGK